MTERAPSLVEHWVIGFNWAIDRKAAQVLLTAVHQAVDGGAKKVTLCLSSPGGLAEQGFYVYEILVALQSHVELITHNIGTVQSAAMPVFLAANRRLAVPHANFLLHATTHNTGGAVSSSHLAYGKASIKADDE